MADNQEFGTVIGPDASFKGDLSFESAAKLLGKFEGSISSKGRVHIADGAECRATVKAKEISVDGRVEGNVEAVDRIDLRPKGMISGDVVAARMVMAEGASIDGYCRIGTDGAGNKPRGTVSTEVKSVSGGSTTTSSPSQQPVAVKK